MSVQLTIKVISMGITTQSYSNIHWEDCFITPLSKHLKCKLIERKLKSLFISNVIILWCFFNTLDVCYL